MTPSRFVSLGRRKNDRRGLLLVAVLVCLLVTMALIGSSLKATLSAHRSSKSDRQFQQAVWLLQAGVERLAVDQATLDPATIDLTTWDARAALPDYEVAEVSYQWIPVSEPSTKILQCTARLGATDSVQHRVELSTDLHLATSLSDSID